jgi:hypothetical protein
VGHFLHYLDYAVALAVLAGALYLLLALAFVQVFPGLKSAPRFRVRARQPLE